MVMVPDDPDEEVRACRGWSGEMRPALAARSASAEETGKAGGEGCCGRVGWNKGEGRGGKWVGEWWDGKI